jgi:DNA recombination protein RmuC
MGFRTLAIERRSSEVWQLLGAVKTQFGQFGGLLEKVHKKLDQASTTIEDAARKSRTIERKLKDVEEIPAESVGELLSLGGAEVDEVDDGRDVDEDGEAHRTCEGSDGE